MLFPNLKPNQHSSNISLLLEILSEVKNKEIFEFQDKEPPQIMIKYATLELSKEYSFLAAPIKYP
jgi:hypothetical protein